MRSRVLELKRDRGLNGMEIARVLGVSHQAIYAHLKALRASGSLDNGKKAT